MELENSDAHSGRIANCAGTKKKIVCILYVIHCPALACKRYRNLGCMFLKPKDLANLRVNGLISLVDNTRLGIAPEHRFKIARR